MSQTASTLLPPSKTASQERQNRGILMAIAIIATWAISIICLLTIDATKLNLLVILPIVLWQTFLYTGLFITAHDAMHGVVLPQNLSINHFVGKVAVSLYALFDYNKLLKKHWLHHQNPASSLDPDFHHAQQQNVLIWYLQFMQGYWSWRQVVALTLLFNLATYTLHIPDRNLVLFWIIPSLLSSAQLFFFGTFLPHREPTGGYQNIHRAQSTPLPIFWSFLACYHFGYHQEHHEYPQVPWWKLPLVYRQRQEVL